MEALIRHAPEAFCLVLCENNPTEETIREEIRLIRQADVSPRVEADLLAIALRLAGRDFSRGVLEAIFREELPMAQGANIVDDWIEEGVERRLAPRLAEAAAEAAAKAAVEAAAESARRFTLRVLRERFTEVPEALVVRIQSADATWCEEFTARAMHVNSLQELAWD